MSARAGVASAWSRPATTAVAMIVPSIAPARFGERRPTRWLGIFFALTRAAGDRRPTSRLGIFLSLRREVSATSGSHGGRLRRRRRHVCPPRRVEPALHVPDEHRRDDDHDDEAEPA